MKGIVLSGGKGTRLRPITSAYQKQLLPIYDKPMIYYPISLLMMLGIREIAIIITSKALNALKEVINDGKYIGLQIEYIVDDTSEGIAKAMTRCKDFVGDDNFVMVLGDTLLYGAELGTYLNKGKEILENKKHAFVFETIVSDPTQFGTVFYNKNYEPERIIEKSKEVFNKRAIPGIYFLTSEAMEYAKYIQKSSRNEYEIISILEEYLKRGALEIQKCGRGIIWIDTGTPKTINMASNIIHIIQESMGIVIACLEELAYNNGWISEEQLKEANQFYEGTEYGEYLTKFYQLI